MKKKKLITGVLSLALAGILFFSQAALIPSQAAMHSTLRVDNQTSLAEIVVQTPTNSANAYSLMNWAEEAFGFKTVLHVNVSNCGPNALKMMKDYAASFNSSIAAMYDPVLNREYGGCIRRTVTTSEPLQLCMTSPNSAADCEYAVLSYNSDATLTVFPDIDSSADTITFTANNFLLWALVSAPKGTFKNYKPLTISKYAASLEKSLLSYPKLGSVFSTIGSDSITTPIKKVGVISDYGTIVTGMGMTDAERALGYKPYLTLVGSSAGKAALDRVNAAIKSVNGQNAVYVDAYLTRKSIGTADCVTKTSLPLTLTFSVPETFPMYADYAVVVLDENGNAKVMKDIDSDASTISITTTNFRMYALIHGVPGSFDKCK